MESYVDSGQAVLMIQLGRWHTAAGIPAALAWLRSDDFTPDYESFQARHPPGSEGDGTAAHVCTFFDAVGSLCRHGLVPEATLFDWLEAGPAWDRLKGYVFGTRRRTALPTLWLNFELLATDHKRMTREYST
ncbi:MAG TPA: hypothetical protein VFB58_03985 [Chloroflexota bacterium]|nr:hypothetical protein [Chloroflexota bacterium]